VDTLVDGVGMNEVPDENLGLLLADAVDTTDALLDAGRFLRQVVIDQQTGKLQIHAF